MFRKLMTAVAFAGLAGPVAATTYTLEDASAAGVYVDKSGLSGQFDLGSYLDPWDTLISARLTVSIADDDDEVMTGTSERRPRSRYVGYRNGYQTYERTTQVVNWSFQPSDILSVTAGGTPVGVVGTSQTSSSGTVVSRVYTGATQDCFTGFGCVRYEDYTETRVTSSVMSTAGSRIFNLDTPGDLLEDGVLSYDLAARDYSYYGTPFVSDAIVTRVALDIEIEEGAPPSVPLPAGGVLMLAALGGLGVMRRRRAR